MKKCKITVYKGIVSDMATEWWTEADWEKHRAFVEECKKDGTYGEPIEYELSFNPMPEFDDPVDDVKPNSHRFILLDMSKHNSDDTDKTLG